MALSIADFFSQADELPIVPVEDLIGTGGVLVIAPHPDDETLGCGGLLAIAKSAGRSVHVVIVSDGAQSHPNSRKYPCPKLSKLRERETMTACGALGLSSHDISFLRLPDSNVPSSGESACNSIADMAIRARAIDAGTIFVTWRNDPHCDHQASFALARAAAHQTNSKLLQYPIWGHTRADRMTLSAPPQGFRLDITQVLDRKKAAIAAHRSQTTYMIDDDPDGFILSPEMIARFERGFEIFLEE